MPQDLTDSQNLAVVISELGSKIEMLFPPSMDHHHKHRSSYNWCSLECYHYQLKKTLKLVNHCCIMVLNYIWRVSI